ncbi:FAD-dependent oxidoreductase [archaeon]|nr:FAD-dependent oxidoreductase [archaeon]
MANVKQLVKKVKENRKKAAVASAGKKFVKNVVPEFDIVIIGAGVSGLAAAMYAGRMNMKTLVIGSAPIGGVITTTNDVENYPGFKSITGLELAEKIKEHALEYPVKLEEDIVTKVEKISGYFKVSTESKKTYNSKTVLFATGTKHRELNVKGEKELANHGVHKCALCDGAFYKDKTVAVIGGSDSAAKEALVLTQWAKKVYIIYRGEKIRSEPVNTKRIEEKIRHDKIEIIYKANVKEIKGNKKVESVILDNPCKGKNEFPLDAVFIEIGWIPLSDVAKSLGVSTNEKGEIIINRNSETNIPGAFAAGDVTDTRFKQAITGVGEAVLAVYSAYLFIEKK